MVVRIARFRREFKSTKAKGVSKVSVGEFADRGSVTRSGFSRTGALEWAGEASRPMVLRLREPRS